MDRDAKARKQQQLSKMRERQLRSIGVGHTCAGKLLNGPAAAAAEAAAAAATPIRGNSIVQVCSAITELIDYSTGR